jgi:homogentisate 1,2-dioxygenase
MSEMIYQSGFGNEFATEAIAGALPPGQNSPQRAPLGLYAEQFSGTAFTAPRGENRRSWLYRIRPSVVHKPFRLIPNRTLRSGPFDETLPTPNQLRWDPLPFPADATDFVDGLVTVAGNGSPDAQSGAGIHIYAATASMHDRFFYNADGEMLVVPQEGRLHLYTEMGMLEAAPGEMCILPRGLKFCVELPDGRARGYVCENYGALFRLPELGPIGANGLANPRDFLTPVAAFGDRDGAFELVAKFQGKLWAAEIGHSPLDVVAWHGNYAPYKYDLRAYSPVGAILFDHPDPSIFTVLTAPSGLEGTANIDFVLFRERWMVAEHSFRPPWYHKNVMSELMGNIYGIYDAKPEGFVPGGMSLHNCMLPHGPDRTAFEGASNAKLMPEKLDETMSFMFETRFPQHLTEWAAKTAPLQDDYIDCWASLDKKFDGKPGEK